MKFGIVVFPGTNCDRDCYDVIHRLLGEDCEFVWHGEKGLDRFDAIILPGGFSYGDYLRTGAIARFSPVMEAVVEAAKGGRPVLGICNGFQILLEAGLLPGAMRRNHTLEFRCHYTRVRVDNNFTPFTGKYDKGEVLNMPIAHGEGNYYCPPEELEKLQQGGQIVLRYCEPDGETTPASNPNGSLENIAGICNPPGNVVGIMPHPERCAEAALGSEDGLRFFTSVVEFLKFGGK